MQITAEGLALIKAHERLRLDAYPDAGYGWARATIGYGHTSAAGAPDVTRGMRITAAEAETILIRDLRKVEQAVRSAIRVPLNDNQYSALVSLVFNIGAGAFGKSTLLRKLNAGDYAGAADQFLVWNKSNGKVLSALKKRRASERSLFLKPVARPAPNHAARPADDGWTAPAPPVPTTLQANAPKLGGLLIFALAAALAAYIKTKG